VLKEKNCTEVIEKKQDSEKKEAEKEKKEEKEKEEPKEIIPKEFAIADFGQLFAKVKAEWNGDINNQDSDSSAEPQVMVLGCGNSKLSRSLFEAGAFRQITSVDVSENQMMNNTTAR
jgi:hypothetical protein